MPSQSLFGLKWLFLWWAIGSSLLAQSASEIDFFESKIRPLFLNHCVECHGAKKQWNGLRLDSLDAMLIGGDSGPSIVPGKPEASLLIQAVIGTGELSMPPKTKLTSKQIDELSRWIREGAIWPKASSVPSPMEIARARTSHWAFQPIAKPKPPMPADRKWSRNPIDDFIAVELDRHQLIPSPETDRRSLLRRLSMDLIGLPPTMEEVEAFQADPRPDAYEHWVERLLSSPHFGEHQARHWLDVARYSDTKGYVYAREERFFVHASTYRDWVVSAFNEDLPYNRFIGLQIAADSMPDARGTDLAAMGFLTLGRRFLGVTHDIIDDRIDVICRGTMGLTVSCARCHDHKYDPIPTADYYSLYGVFQNCLEKSVPLADVQSLPTTEAYRAELQKRESSLAEKLKSSREVASQRIRARLGDYLFAQTELQKYPEEGFDVVLEATDLIPMSVRAWERFLSSTKRERDPIFGPWFLLSGIDDATFAREAPPICEAIQQNTDFNKWIRIELQTPPASKRELADRYQAAIQKVQGMDASTDPDQQAILSFLTGPGSPCEIRDEPVVNIEYFFDLNTCTELWKLQGEVDRWRNQSEVALPIAVALYDRPHSTEARLFKRGNPANKGEVVPRHFLSLFSEGPPPPFQSGSGRSELAKEILREDNPLTARVWVNRIWLHHFGEGLVTTPSDFGVRAEPPSHPELLDWLANYLISSGWQTKDLHRMIVTSATYRQASHHQEEAVASRARRTEVDPDNRKLWRMNARRLSFEELRDSLLEQAGTLNRQMGGKPTPLLASKPSDERRSLYGLVDRQFLLSTLRVFDFANPDLHIPKRSETQVPQQSLFFMNHPWVGLQAKNLVKQLRHEQIDAPESDLIRQLYQRVLLRPPERDELAVAQNFLSSSRSEPKEVIPESVKAWQYGYAVIDEAGKTLSHFKELPHFTGTSWQGGSAYPDSKLGWVQVTAEGGHPGNDLRHAAVRRWIAPKSMEINIRSVAQHDPDVGDGVRLSIFSSRQGLLKTTNLFHSKCNLDLDRLAVVEGESIDFVADILKVLNSDQHLWRPIITESTDGSSAGKANSQSVWDAKTDYMGPAKESLDAWEQLAQVLILCNEWMFVD